MRRRLFTFCSAFSLVLCVVGESLSGERRERAFRVYSTRGTFGVNVCWLYNQWGEPSFRLKPTRYNRWPEPFPQRSAESLGAWRVWRVPGLTHYAVEPGIIGTSSIRYGDWAVGVSYALPAALFALLPAVYARRFLRAGRRPGDCPACGYDLRATPGRCPECGRTAA